MPKEAYERGRYAARYLAAFQHRQRLHAVVCAITLRQRGARIRSSIRAALLLYCFTATLFCLLLCYNVPPSQRLHSACQLKTRELGQTTTHLRHSGEVLDTCASLCHAKSAPAFVLDYY